MRRFPLQKIAPSGRFIEDPESAPDRTYLPLQIFRKLAGIHPRFLILPLRLSVQELLRSVPPRSVKQTQLKSGFTIAMRYHGSRSATFLNGKAVYRASASPYTHRVSALALGLPIAIRNPSPVP